MPLTIKPNCTKQKKKAIKRHDLPAITGLFWRISAERKKSMNTVNVIGRLVKDPEINRIKGGTTVCNMRIAIDDMFSKDDRADFLSVAVFGSQAELCEKYLRKGYLAGVSGHLRSDAYTDPEGIKRYPVKLIADRVQFLTRPERGEPAREEPAMESSTVDDTLPDRADLR